MGGTRVKHERTRRVVWHTDEHDGRFYVYANGGGGGGGLVWNGGKRGGWVGGERSRTKPKWNEGKRKEVEEERGEVEAGVGGGGWVGGWVVVEVVVVS